MCVPACTSFTVISEGWGCTWGVTGVTWIRCRFQEAISLRLAELDLNLARVHVTSLAVTLPGEGGVARLNVGLKFLRGVGNFFFQLLLIFLLNYIFLAKRHHGLGLLHKT